MASSNQQDKILNYNPSSDKHEQDITTADPRVFRLTPARLRNLNIEADLEKACDKMKAKVRQLYPQEPEPAIALYFDKIQREMMLLKKATKAFYEAEHHVCASCVSVAREKIDMKKQEIHSYFSTPGAVAEAVERETRDATATEA